MDSINDEQIFETYIRACFKFAIVMVPTLLAFIFDVWIVSCCNLPGYKVYLYSSIALIGTYAIYRFLLWVVKLTSAEEDIIANNFDYPSSPSTENIEANNFAIRIDPKYLGVPNVCFSLSDEDDPREPGYKKQRLERGFDDTEATWGLDCTIAKFILPRLIAFRDWHIEDGKSWDMNNVNELGEWGKLVEPAIWTNQEWVECLNKMIFAFEFVIAQDKTNEFSNQDLVAKYKEGMELFAENFHRLWT